MVEQSQKGYGVIDNYKAWKGSEKISNRANKFELKVGEVVKKIPQREDKEIKLQQAFSEEVNYRLQELRKSLHLESRLEKETVGKLNQGSVNKVKSKLDFEIEVEGKAKGMSELRGWVDKANLVS